ncbi:MAG: BMP family ABC transporter substrate-binding protein, partial [Leucobacter sp.]|nr:BMP family ABC transporter substrate-binding protein [Leucobacter sp.]
MSITTKKLVGVTAAAGLIFGLSACGQAPDQGGEEGGATSEFLSCIVSDA